MSPPFCVFLQGVRPLSTILFVGALSCATTSKQAELEADCREDLTRDPRCIDVLTGGGEAVEYESRAEVMAAEEARKAQAFEDRLARLRREEEERQLRRIQSSSVSHDLDPDAMEAIAEGAGEEDDALPGDELEGLAGARLSDEKEVADLGGSSVRAIEKVEPKDEPLVVRKPRPIQKEVATPIAPAAAPTPEAYFRGARCMLGEDLEGLRETFARARIPALAVTILDAETLVKNIEAEMAHRHLETAAACAPGATSVVRLLRTLVGPPAVDGATSDAYARGLARLRKELEVRAGLPRKVD